MPHASLANMSNRAPTADSHHAGRQRWWRVGQNAGAQIAARVVSGLCQLALVPLILSRLGVDSFGWTMALTTFVGLSQFTDLGVAMALQQALSEAWAHGDDDTLRRVYASGARLLALLGLGWLVVCVPAAWALGEHVLVSPGGVDNAKACWIVVAACLAAGVPLSAGNRLAVALQLGWIAAFWTALTSVATLVAAWLLARAGAHPGALTYVVLLSAGQLAPGLICGLHIPRRLGWRGRSTAEWNEMHRLRRAALPFASQNLAGALLQAATPWAFARFGGYAANAAFAILQRLFGLAQQAHALLLSPIWPAYAEAQIRHDRTWISRMFRYSLFVTFPVVAGVLLAAAMLPWILPLWLGKHALIPPAGITWPVVLWFLTAIVGQPLVLLLLGLGRFQRMAVQVMIVHLLTLAAMVGWGKWQGATGVALALAGGLTLGVLPLYVREAVLALRALPQSASTADARAAKV